MTELDHIDSFFSSETLRTMSKNHKVAYKYCLGAIFINIIVGGGRIRGQEENYGIAEAVKGASGGSELDIARTRQTRSIDVFLGKIGTDLFKSNEA